MILIFHATPLDMPIYLKPEEIVSVKASELRGKAEVKYVVTMIVNESATEVKKMIRKAEGRI